MKNQLTTIRDPWGGHCLLFELLNKPQALETRFELRNLPRISMVMCFLRSPTSSSLLESLKKAIPKLLSEESVVKRENHLFVSQFETSHTASLFLGKSATRLMMEGWVGWGVSQDLGLWLPFWRLFDDLDLSSFPWEIILTFLDSHLSLNHISPNSWIICHQILESHVTKFLNHMSPNSIIFGGAFTKGMSPKIETAFMFKDQIEFWESLWYS